MINGTCEIGIQTLIYLARQGGGEPHPPKVIAAALKASPTYTAKVCGALVRAGILRAHRGAKGGVTLLAKPEQVTLLDVMEACQGKLLADYCSEVFNLDHVCNWHRALDELHKAMVGVLEKWTLADILRCPFPSAPLNSATHCRIAKPEFDWLKPD
jgi:Rrf2 family protein